MSYIFTPAINLISVPVVGASARFPVRRVFCVGANYAAHAREMGRDDRQEPFFFMKPNDALIVAEKMDDTVSVPYPSLTNSLHHEIELVVALGEGAKIFGYALGLDMTRRDLQNVAKEKKQPWDMAKGFDGSAPISPIVKSDQMPDVADAGIQLDVNGAVRQQVVIADMVWNIAEVVEKLSTYVALRPGDLIFTGTPEGVGAVYKGDKLAGRCGSQLRLSASII